MKFFVLQRIAGFALGYEIPVFVSRSKRGKLRGYQKGERDKVGFMLGVVAFGLLTLASVIMLGGVLSRSYPIFTICLYFFYCILSRVG